MKSSRHKLPLPVNSVNGAGHLAVFAMTFEDVGHIKDVLLNLLYKVHQIPKFKCFSSRLAVVFDKIKFAETCIKGRTPGQ